MEWGIEEEDGLARSVCCLAKSGQAWGETDTPVATPTDHQRKATVRSITFLYECLRFLHLVILSHKSPTRF